MTLTDEQWALLEPVFNAPGKRGPKHAPDLRRVVDAVLYVLNTLAVDVTGLPVGALVAPASTHENRTTELMLEHLGRQGVTGRLELVPARLARLIRARPGTEDPVIRRRGNRGRDNARCVRVGPLGARCGHER